MATVLSYLVQQVETGIIDKEREMNVIDGRNGLSKLLMIASLQHITYAS